MLMVEKLLPGGRGIAPALRARAARLALDWDRRSKSRLAATDSSDRSLGVVLPRGTQMRGGDVLVADDGSMIVVEAAPQPVLQVRAPVGPAGPFLLMRAAYHLGNRHVPLQLTPEVLTLEPDPVLADMLRRMGLTVEERLAPFEPEGGAYTAEQGHAHPHTHSHAHPHAHAHAHDPLPPMPTIAAATYIEP